MIRFLAILAVALASTTASGFDPAQQDDSLALVRHFKPQPDPVELPTEQGLFSDQTGLTVSLMGGADVFRMQEFGYLEAMLQTAFPDQKIRVRNLGWSSDTVFRQQRPMFFYTAKGDAREGSIPDGRNKIAPGVFVLSFGKMESLNGLDALADFEAAYDRLIGQLQKLSKRIVVVQPVPFAKVGPAARLTEERNVVLAKYSEVIESVAERRGVKNCPQQSMPEGAFEKTGIHLSSVGMHGWASRVFAAINGKGLECPVGKDDSNHEDLFKAILEKNHLWDQYYRPTNWAFLYGDRQQVPSSRDHKNPEKRWFEEELKRYPALIVEKEKEIWKLAKGGGR